MSVMEDYTAGELKQIHKQINENLEEIKVEVKKTNGRVRALENWRWFITGGLAILSILIIPILLKLLTL